MLIILEGADGSGKTTLAQALATHLGRTTSDQVEVWHAARPERHPLDEYLRPLRTYRPGMGRHLILDRWHWGERVYPAVLGRETHLDEPAWWSIEAYLRRLGALVVLCDRNLTAEYRQIYRERGLDGTPDAWQLTHLTRIRDEFSRTIYRSALPVCQYAVGDDTISHIAETARLLGERYRVLNDFATYLGPLRPVALLLGDVRNAKTADAATYDPAFVPFRGTSGYYLLRALTSLPSRDYRRSIGVANACDADDVAKLHRTLGEPPLAALGVNAARRLAEFGLSHGTVPHPQFVRRFHHGRHHEYGWAIYDAARYGKDLSKWPLSSTEPTDATSTPTSSTRSGSSGSFDPVAKVPPSI